MAEYPMTKEPLMTLTVTTTIRGIKSSLSSLDEIKLIALRLNIPLDADVNIASNKDGWSDSVTFTWKIQMNTHRPKSDRYLDREPNVKMSEWFGNPPPKPFPTKPPV